MNARGGVTGVTATARGETEDRLPAYNNWMKVTEDLSGHGCAVIDRLLSAEECRQIAGLYPEESHFRSHVHMARHGFGKGEYRYFKYPLPELLASLRTALYLEARAALPGYHPAASQTTQSARGRSLTMSHTRQSAYVLLVAAAVVYGAIFSVNKMAAAAGLPPLAYGFWQSFGAGLLLWIILALKGEKLALSRGHLLSYLVIGALAVGIPISLLTYAAPHLPAGLLTIVLALSPPLTFLLGMLVRIDRFRVLGLLGLVFGFLGVLVIIGPGLSADASGAWQWFALSLIAPLLFAGSNVSAALLRPPLSSSFSMASGMLLGSSAVLIPIMLLTGQAALPAGAGTIATLIAVGINAVFFVMFFEIIRIAGPTFFAQFNYLAVLAGVAWSMLVYGERLSIYFFVAMLLIFAGVFLSARGAGRPIAADRGSKLS